MSYGVFGMHPAIDNFLATLDGLSLEDALANLELDALSFGWSRGEVREAAHRIRMHYARKVVGLKTAAYTVKGTALTLSEQTSRACGYLLGFDGDRLDWGKAEEARRQIHRDAQILANSLRRPVEVYASHPDEQDWVVEVVEPERHAEEVDR